MATMSTRGDVWLVDLGMVAKVRPCLVLSIPADDNNDRLLATLVPHTTSTRDSRFEVASNFSSQGHLMHRTSSRFRPPNCYVALARCPTIR